MSFYQNQYDDYPPPYETRYGTPYGAPYVAPYSDSIAKPHQNSGWPSFPEAQPEPFAFPQPLLGSESQSNFAPFSNPPTLPPRPSNSRYHTNPASFARGGPWDTRDSYPHQTGYGPGGFQSNSWPYETGPQSGYQEPWSIFSDSGPSRTNSYLAHGCLSSWLPESDVCGPQTEAPQEMRYSGSLSTGPASKDGPQEAMAKAAIATRAMTALEEDIEAAMDKIANTLENFKQLQPLLGFIDGQNLVREKFAPDWQKLYDKYYDILTLSQTHADEIAAFGTHFDKNICQYGALSSDTAADERIVMIQNSLIITKKLQSDSAALEKEIDNLSCGLSDIAEKLKPEMFPKTRLGEIETQLDDIHIRIEEIKNEIGAVDNRILGVAKQLKASEIGGGIAQAVIPRFGLGLLRAGTKSTQYQNEIEAQGVLREGKQQEIDNLELRARTARGHLEQIDGALAGVQGQIADIRETIKNFAQVWAGIKGRCDEIILFLEVTYLQPQSVMAKTNHFLKFTALPQTYYSVLGEVLGGFAKGLGNFTKP